MTYLPDPTDYAGLRQGDRKVFEQLFRAWFPRLAGYALRITGNPDAAEDVVQDVFVRIWEKIENLPEAAQLPAYLFRAVRNRALNHQRQLKTSDRLAAAALDDPVIMPEALARVEVPELQFAVTAALRKLSPRELEVFMLSRRDGLTYSSIAQTLGISVKTVETLMGRALKSLRSQLADLRDNR